MGGFFIYNGCILLILHTVSRALPSPMEDLTSEFEMGSGISPPLSTHPIRILFHKSLNISSDPLTIT